MTYEETIKFLFNQLPMYQREGKQAFKKDLTNIIKLCSFLGNPQDKFPCIHIAGTNGKGTTAHLLAAVLQASGLKVGIYTSPHYVDYRERVKVNGTYISKEFVTAFINKVRQNVNTVLPSFFEFSVAMAFDYFAANKVDVAIIETGLGGRLDSTNIIHPLLSIITNISMDHQAMLGDSLYIIAGEKAGIIKANTPVVIGKYQREVDHVFIKKANEESSKIYFAALRWNTSSENDVTSFKSNLDDGNYQFDLSNESPFLKENITTSLESLRHVKAYFPNLDNSHISYGIQNFRHLSNYIGRWQILHNQPLVIGDSAHNLEALEHVLKHLEILGFKKIHFVLGFVKDKDVDELLSLFNPAHTYYFTRPNVVRGLNEQVLFEKSKAHRLNGSVYQDVASAIDTATNSAAEDDLVFVGGSSFVVADALAAMETAG